MSPFIFQLRELVNSKRYVVRSTYYWVERQVPKYAGLEELRNILECRFNIYCGRTVTATVTFYDPEKEFFAYLIMKTLRNPFQPDDPELTLYHSPAAYGINGIEFYLDSYVRTSVHTHNTSIVNWKKEGF